MKTVAYNTPEIARNPGASSHRAAPARTYVMKQLGVQTPGFWADWAKRKINPYGGQGQAADLSMPANKGITPITPYQSQNYKYQAEKPSDLKIKPVQMETGEAGGGGSSNTGRTKAALQAVEKQSVWNDIKGEIARTPTLSTTVLDTMDAERINMDRQMMMYMHDNPSKMLTDAASDYFMRHPAYSAINTAQTNFEKQVSLYSETKKIAEKQQGYAAAESNKKMNELIKNQKTYSSPQYMGGTMLNIGKGSGYNPMPYLSPFG